MKSPVFRLDETHQTSWREESRFKIKLNSVQFFIVKTFRPNKIHKNKKEKINIAASYKRQLYQCFHWCDWYRPSKTRIYQQNKHTDFTDLMLCTRVVSGWWWTTHHTDRGWGTWGASGLKIHPIPVKRPSWDRDCRAQSRSSWVTGLLIPAETVTGNLNVVGNLL